MTPLRHRLLPPFLVLLAVGAMLLLHRAWPVDHLRWPPLTLLVPALTLVAGLGLALVAAGRFRRVGTNINTFRDPGTLVTDGPFRLSRNPMYLGMAVFLLGFAGLLGSASPLLVVVAFVLITDRWYIAFEERRMLDRFGAAYREYQRGTRRWL